MLDEYISSGKLEANQAKYKQEIIDAVRLGKPAMTIKTYDAMAKTGAAEKGKVTRVVITSAVWTVAKTEYGFPLHKYLDVDLATTDANGKCWLLMSKSENSMKAVMFMVLIISISGVFRMK